MFPARIENLRYFELHGDRCERETKNPRPLTLSLKQIPLQLRRQEYFFQRLIYQFIVHWSSSIYLTDTLATLSNVSPAIWGKHAIFGGSGSRKRSWLRISHTHTLIEVRQSHRIISVRCFREKCTDVAHVCRLGRVIRFSIFVLSAKDSLFALVVPMARLVTVIATTFSLLSGSTLLEFSTSFSYFRVSLGDFQHAVQATKWPLLQLPTIVRANDFRN